jgi:DegT/DnrJ/EryC1/StrS aminotransferase family
MAPSKPFQIVKDFEDAVAAYTGATHCVAVNSCTMALRLALEWHLRNKRPSLVTITIPKRTYVSVPMQIMHAGCEVGFHDGNWVGVYRLEPFHIWDSARHFTSGMFTELMSTDRAKYEVKNAFVCVSFHSTKILGIKRPTNEMHTNARGEGPPWDIEQGGAILHNCPEADPWFRRMRFDGRTEGVPPKEDNFRELGFHCYMNPSTARLGLKLLKELPLHNPPLPNDDYPDLSTFEIFK